MIPQAEDFALIHFVNLVVGDARDFHDRGQGHGKEAAADAEQQRLNTGERERHAKLERSAAAPL